MYNRCEIGWPLQIENRNLNDQDLVKQRWPTDGDFGRFLR